MFLNYAASRGLTLCLTPEALVDTEADYYGRPQRLTAQALRAWSQMKSCAAESEITLHLISAYRSPDYQYELLKRKLDAGQSLEQILQVNAAPGYSEHHTGRAVDVGTRAALRLLKNLSGLRPSPGCASMHVNLALRSVIQGIIRPEWPMSLALVLQDNLPERLQRI